MATMHVSLPKTVIDFVEELVAKGDYASSSDVVGEALRLLHEERSARGDKSAVLRQEIAAGLKDAAADRFSRRSVSDIAASVLGEAPRR